MNRVVNGRLILKLKEIIDDETEVLSGTEDEYEVKLQTCETNKYNEYVQKEWK